MRRQLCAANNYGAGGYFTKLASANLSIYQSTCKSLIVIIIVHKLIIILEWLKSHIILQSYQANTTLDKLVTYICLYLPDTCYIHIKFTLCRVAVIPLQHTTIFTNPYNTGTIYTICFQPITSYYHAAWPLMYISHVICDTTTGHLRLPEVAFMQI